MRSDPAVYLGDPPHFPGYGPDAARLLVERGVGALGIDTLGVDPGEATDFPVHHITLPAGLFHLEGLIGLDAVPDTGATVVVGALRLPGASGTPARVFALLPLGGGRPAFADVVDERADGVADGPLVQQREPGGPLRVVVAERGHDALVLGL